MKNAKIRITTMGDGSRTYDVIFQDDKGNEIATIAAMDKAKAHEIADAINGASWIQFHKQG